MNRFIPIILLAASLAACTPPKRFGLPAPIITAGRLVPKPPVPSPKKEVAKIYPYRLPAFAPDTPVPQDSIPAQESRQAKAAPVFELTAKSTSEQGTRTRPTKVPSKGTMPTPGAVAVASPPLPGRLSPAVSKLVKQAEQQRRARDYVVAAANLERALGLQPLEPYVWNRLARVRMEQGRYDQACNLASRSNVLAGRKQSALTRDNQNIIAAAQQAASDTVGAKEARRNVRGG